MLNLLSLFCKLSMGALPLSFRALRETPPPSQGDGTSASNGLLIQ